MRKLTTLKKIEVLKIWNYELGEDAYRHEHYVLGEFSYTKWMDDNLLLIDGNSEMFRCVILGLDRVITV